jgi:hypothetical protein
MDDDKDAPMEVEIPNELVERAIQLSIGLGFAARAGRWSLLSPQGQVYLGADPTELLGQVMRSGAGASH